MAKHGKKRGSKPHLLTANDVAAVDEAEAHAGLNHHDLPHYKSPGHKQYEGLQHVDEQGQHELNHHPLPPPSPRAGKRKAASEEDAVPGDDKPAGKRPKTSQGQAMDTEEAAPEQPGGAKLAAKAKKVPGKRGQAARKQKEEQQVQGPEENTTAEEQGAGGEEGQLPGEDGDIHEMVAKELGEYFQSAEGAGAFRIALGKYLMEHMAKEMAQTQAQAQQKAKRNHRSRGRRHHRCASIAVAAEAHLEDE